MVSPRANIATNWSIRLERVSGFVAFAILFFGPFMLAMLTDFMGRVFSHIPDYVK